MKNWRKFAKKLVGRLIASIYWRGKSGHQRVA